MTTNTATDEYVKIGAVYWERDSVVIESNPVSPDDDSAIIMADDYDGSRGATPWETDDRFGLDDPPEEYGWFQSFRVIENDVSPETFLRLRNVE